MIMDLPEKRLGSIGVLLVCLDSLKAGTEDFVFTEEGTMNSYLGVDISQFPDKKGFTLSQTFLIDRFIQALNFDTKNNKECYKQYTS